MKARIFLVITLIFFVSLIFSQNAPDTLWTRTIDREWMMNETFSVQQTFDGGFIVGGNTENYDNPDYRDLWLMKFNGAGDLLWEKKYMEDEHYETGGLVVQASDGGFVIVGMTDFPDYTNDIIVIKTDNEGNYEWHYIFQEFGVEIEATSIQLTSDNGYIISGWIGDEFTNQADGLLLKINNSGNLEWSQTYNFTLSSINEKAYSVYQTVDSGFIICGDYCIYDENYNLTSDIFVLKVNNSGDYDWHEFYPLNDNGYARSIKQTNNEDFILTGYSGNDEVSVIYNIVLIKIDNDSSFLWESHYYDDEYDNQAYDIEITSDNCYVISGYIHSDHGILIKTDEEGDTIWEKILYNGEKKFYDVQQTEDDGFILAGTCWGDLTDGYLVRLDNTVSVENNLIIEPDFRLMNFPNPFKGLTTISFSVTQKTPFVNLEIYNIKGQKVKQFSLDDGRCSIDWNGSDENNKLVSNGTYFYKMSVGGFTSVKKMILMK